MTKIKIGIVDDHRLFREGIIKMISDWGNTYEIVLEAINGIDLMKKLETNDKPHIIIMDAKMPLMNGSEATIKVKDKYPEILVLAVTMLDGKTDFIRLVRAGIDGFLTKNTSVEEVKEAVDSLIDLGHYFKERQLDQMLLILRGKDDKFKSVQSLTEKEMRFIQFATSEMTYREIANEMHLSEKTVDGYRSKVFEKLDVKTRVGLVIRAVKEGIVQL